MGTQHRKVSPCAMAKESVERSDSACMYMERWENATPLGAPVVPVEYTSAAAVFSSSSGHGYAVERPSSKDS